MQTWIFQANPDRFDIDRFLDEGPDETLWLVRRQGHQMQIGDQVFIWRSAGKDHASSGIIAECRMIETPLDQRDNPNERKFWSNPQEADTKQPRIRLRIVRAAHKKGVLEKKWLEGDPVASGLTILKMANATNYLVPEDQARRLNDMWRVAGQNWTRTEAVAGLWAYYKTLGREVSKKPGQPVAQVALKTGRAISGIYNNVMNYRHIDPNDARAGMSGAGDMRRSVWSAFYLEDEGRLDGEEIEAEFQRLWGDVSDTEAQEEAATEDAALRKEVERLTSLSIGTLWLRYESRSGSKAGASKQRKPRSRSTKTRIFDRDPLIVAITKVSAGFKCEVPDCHHPPFIDTSGRPYCEVHHIEPLSEGGTDDFNNVICLCPAHHVEAHFGKDRERLTEAFSKLRLTYKIQP